MPAAASTAVVEASLGRLCPFRYTAMTITDTANHICCKLQNKRSVEPQGLAAAVMNLPSKTKNFPARQC